MTIDVYTKDHSQHGLARMGGLLYLLLIPTAAPGILHGQLLIHDNAAQTLTAISDNRLAFEVTTLLGVIGFVIFLALAMVLHRLFRSYCAPAADIMLGFVAVSVPLSLAAMAFRLDVLNLIDASNGLSTFSGQTLQAEVALAMARSANMMQVAVIFWGLWLLPLSQLARRSGFVPPILPILLTIGGLFYVATFIGYVFDSAFQQSMAGMVLGSLGGLSAMIGEIGLAIWLLVKGTSWSYSDSALN